MYNRAGVLAVVASDCIGLIRLQPYSFHQRSRLLRSCSSSEQWLSLVMNIICMYTNRRSRSLLIHWLDKALIQCEIEPRWFSVVLCGIEEE